MITFLFWLILKILGALLVLALIFLGYKMWASFKLLSHYEEQGFTVMRGSRNFPLGLVTETARWDKLRD